MIGYTLIGTNDKAKAVAFYDALFAPLEARKLEPNDRVVLWSTGAGTPMFGIAVPFDGEAANVGNGVMISLAMKDADTVSALHAKAVDLGGADEGAPGVRGSGRIFIGYCRDLDGNKIAFFCPNRG